MIPVNRKWAPGLPAGGADVETGIILAETSARALKMSREEARHIVSEFLAYVTPAQTRGIFDELDIADEAWSTALGVLKLTPGRSPRTRDEGHNR